MTTALFKLNGEQNKYNELIKAGGEADVTQAIEKQQEIIKEIDAQLQESGRRGKTRLFQKKAEAEQEIKMLEGRLQTIESDKKIEQAKTNLITKTEKENKLADEKSKKFKDFIKKQELSKELLEASINGNREEVELQHAINAAVEIHGEKNRQKITDILTANAGLEDQVDKIKETGNAASELESTFAQIGETIGSQITDALVGAINGTKSLGDAARSILNDLANSLLRMGINTLLGGILPAPISGFLGFANGGRPPVGKPSVVGEKGPEIFVPSTAGTVIPNNKLGGSTNNIVVNVDASGSSVEGDEQSGRALGRLIGIAVQSEIVAQQRPGGLLA